MKYEELVSKMTLEEKAGLCSGKDFWHLKGVERLGIPSIMMTDGPHGLRKQPGKGDHAGIGGSVPATCFLPACASAASWDKDMLYKMGKALGEEALQENVSVVLGPGVNMKRSPLCGRNFEYFSSDPFLAGKLAANFIRGVQSNGIGTSLKHFAGNNQETRRQTIDSVIDERALREIYLSAFEIAVKEGKPWTVMNAYNRLNGTFCSENEYLLNDVLRKDWKYDGVVITDWGAENDRVKGLKAGNNVEMPASGGINDARIVEAVKSGELDESVLDESVDKVLDLIMKAKSKLNSDYEYDKKAHHRLVREAAAESMVLLKNDDKILPLKKGDKFIVIGEMAKKPRFQGAGSSFISPTKLDDAMSVFKDEYGFEPKYAKGYDSESDKPDEKLIDEAVALAQSDTDRKVLIFAGLTDMYESEAFDREHMRIPENQLELIKRVTQVNKNVIILLHCGSPVEMPFIDDVRAVMCCYLVGQAGAGAIVDLIYGKNNPSGKLPETFPLSFDDVPCSRYFPAGPLKVEYRESVFVDYRYYDTAKKDVLFPFGFGLSYTDFEFSDISLSQSDIRGGESVKVTFKIKNTGKTDGAEVCQVYVGLRGGKIFRPEKELREFTKLFLKAGEEKEVTLELSPRAFEYFDVNTHKFEIENGEYNIYVGDCINNLPLKAALGVTSQNDVQTPDYRRSAPCYYKADIKNVSDEEFESILGRKIPPEKWDKEHKNDLNSCFIDMREHAGGRFVNKLIVTFGNAFVGGTKANKKMSVSMALSTPVRVSVMMSNGAMTLAMGRDIVRMCSGHFWSGFALLIHHSIFRTKKSKMW